jgi:hypothetical protein
MPQTLQNSPLLPIGHGLHIYIYIYHLCLQFGFTMPLFISPYAFYVDFQRALHIF